MSWNLPFHGLEKEATFLNLITVPAFVYITSLTLVGFSCHSINIRRALKRWMLQDAAPHFVKGKISVEREPIPRPFWGISTCSLFPQRRRQGLELRTWTAAVWIFVLYANALVLLVLVFRAAIEVKPSLRAYLPPALHPISIHRLLLCRSSAACNSLEALTDEAGNDLDARLVLILLGWVLMVIAVLLSAWRQYGWEDGVKAIWRGADRGWSYPHGTWSTEAMPEKTESNAETSDEEGVPLQVDELDPGHDGDSARIVKEKALLINVS